MTDALLPGEASGSLLVLTEPLSFWGGVDARTGRIIDRSHPEAGQSVTSTILYMPHGRGSSSSASVIAETIRNGVGPVGFILAEADEIVVTGVFIANTLYGTRVPVVVDRLPGSTGDRVYLTTEGARVEFAE